MNTNDFPVHRALLAAVAAGAAVMAAGCAGPFDLDGPHAPDTPPYADTPRAVDPAPPSMAEPPKAPVDQDPGTLRACASFVTVEHLVQRTITPDKRLDGTTRPTSNLIDLASTVNSTRREGLSDALDRAFTAYAYSLTSLGAHIDHKQPADEISEMIQVVNNSGAVIKALCREPSSDTYGGIGESAEPRGNAGSAPYPGDFPGRDAEAPRKSAGN